MQQPGAERPIVFISVDVETSGPNPSDFSMLSIGACLVDDPSLSFYVELKPVGDGFRQSALDVSGLTMEGLAATGTEAPVAMEQFATWVDRVVPDGHSALFVGFNAPFDWMFVEDYFQRYLGRNPFGHSAVDVKAYYMGMTGSSWAETSMRHLAPRYLGGTPLSHNALEDARAQARLFDAIRSEAGHSRHTGT